MNTRAFLTTILVAVFLLPYLACGDKTETEEQTAVGPGFKQEMMPIALAPATVSFEWEWNRFYQGGDDYYHSTLLIVDTEHTFESAAILMSHLSDCDFGCPDGYTPYEMALCDYSGDTAFFEIVFENPYYMSGNCVTWRATFDEPDGQQNGWWRGYCSNEDWEWTDPREQCEPEGPGKGEDPPPFEW